MRYRILVAYDGTNYSGWQRLGHRSNTLQQVLEDVLSRLYNQPITLMGSGRTDAGAHAYEQNAHFDAPHDPRRLKTLKLALERLTPKDITIREVWQAPDHFHALQSATGKTYQYSICNARVPEPFTRRFSYHYHKPLNLDYLQQASEFLVGKQDFKSFMSKGTPVLSTVRTITQATWKQGDGAHLVFTISGNGFLKQMVRNIVGTLIEMHQEKAPPESIMDIIEAKDRRVAGPTAPPEGLCLTKVYYPESLDIACHKI